MIRIGSQVRPLSELRFIARSMLLGTSPSRSIRASQTASKVPLLVVTRAGMRYCQTLSWPSRNKSVCSNKGSASKEVGSKKKQRTKLRLVSNRYSAFQVSCQYAAFLRPRSRKKVSHSQVNAVIAFSSRTKSCFPEIARYPQVSSSLILRVSIKSNCFGVARISSNSPFWSRARIWSPLTIMLQYLPKGVVVHLVSPLARSMQANRWLRRWR